MKLPSVRFKSVYAKLFLSYAALLLVTTVAVGATSYLFFTSSLNDEVEKVHSRMLTHTSEQLQVNLLEKAEKIFADLATNADVHYLFDNPVAGNHARVGEILQYLRAMVALNPNQVESVSVYYRGSNAIISSNHGLALLDSLPDKVTVSTDWIERMNRADTGSIWLETRKVPVSTTSDTFAADVVSYVGGYPYYSMGMKAKGFISVNLKAEAFYQMIRSTDQTDRGQLWIMSESGRIISMGNPEAEIGTDEGMRLLANMRGSEKGEFSDWIGGVSALVSYTKIPTTDWLLVQATPTDEYNRKAAAIQRTLVFVCLAAIGLGLIFSRVLTSSMYMPLKALLHTVKSLFNTSFPASPGKHENEYKQIDDFVANLSVKMSGLEATVSENIPIIRHNLVFGLLNRTITQEAELSDRLRFLGLDWTEPFYSVLLVRIDERDMSALSEENRQVVVYNLIRELEQMRTGDISFSAISSSATDISAIVNCRIQEDELLRGIAERLSAFGCEQFRVRLAASSGGWVVGPLRLYLSCREAQDTIEQRFFRPDTVFFAHADYGIKGTAHEEIPEAMQAAFTEALKGRDLSVLKETLSDFVRHLEAGRFTAEYGHEKWKQWVGLYRQYIKDMHLKSSEVIGERLMEQFQTIADIREFEAWLLEAAEQTFRFVEERSRNKSGESIGEIKRYVEEHLAEDLSLQIVAERVSLHPRYVSQLFKEETGVNFVDYVNKRRIEAAAQLIKTTDLNVEQIANRVGFNTPAYFIKKFKEVYGVTPKAYKFNYTTNQ
ncbi:AraC family transcriptional regulator [Paenibacillus sp. MBLB4367]|uniref:AraC family transcriptional regulator n=1 Tax=Paenibacillus sp. MBLB4367 TaxID=3384767 RepID=UPI00390843B1